MEFFKFLRNKREKIVRCTTCGGAGTISEGKNLKVDGNYEYTEISVVTCPVCLGRGFCKTTK